jgi:hypothetical protein
MYQNPPPYTNAMRHEATKEAQPLTPNLSNSWAGTHAEKHALHFSVTPIHPL